MRPRRRLSPRQVGQCCLRHAWRNNIDDRSRLLLEQASLVIEHLADRVESNAKCLEIVEAELASRSFPLLDDEDPGMGL